MTLSIIFNNNIIIIIIITMVINAKITTNWWHCVIIKKVTILWLINKYISICSYSIFLYYCPPYCLLLLCFVIDILLIKIVHINAGIDVSKTEFDSIDWLSVLYICVTSEQRKRNLFKFFSQKKKKVLKPFQKMPLYYVL